MIGRGNDAGTFGAWHLRLGARTETVKVHGPLAANDGECALAWAPNGHGILIRSLREAASMLCSGRLRSLLQEWSLPPADIYAVCPTRSRLSAKTRALVDFLLSVLEQHRVEADDGW